MGDAVQQAPDFESVKTRLAEIADIVGDENLSLDDALDLYEEAVALGLKASDLLEIGINPSEGEVDEVREGIEALSPVESDGVANVVGEQQSGRE